MRRHTPVLAFLAAVALLALGASTAIAHSTAHDRQGTFSGPPATVFPPAYATSVVHVSTVRDVPQGTTISASLTWDDPDADLDLHVEPPSSTCSLGPPPDVPCLLPDAPSPSDPPQPSACDSNPGGTFQPPGAPTSESVSTTAPTTGTYEVWVEANFVPPDTTVSYDMDFTVDEHGTIGDSTVYLIDSGAGCEIVG